MLDIPSQEVARRGDVLFVFPPSPEAYHLPARHRLLCAGRKADQERIKELLDAEIGETTKDRPFTLRWPDAFGAPAARGLHNHLTQVYKQVKL